MHQQELGLEGRGCNFRTSRDFPLKSRTVSQAHIQTYLLFLFLFFNGRGVFRWLAKKRNERIRHKKFVCNPQAGEAGGRCWWVAAAELST